MKWKKYVPGRLAGLLLACVLMIGWSGTAWSQTTHKRVLFQGFWWDYWNNNYPGSWANYLADLAPRLRTMGVDAIWIPPSIKNANAGCQGVGCVGYSPFDHYDLGDKYQRTNSAEANRTRLGTKDELLRMIAVMHANGIEVVQDIVLNHIDGASVADPAALAQQTAGGYKNFRYASYATPSLDPFNQCDYFELAGRWTKNYPNFHPHSGHNSTGEDWTESFWGPDICYGYLADGTGNGYGSSSNCTACPDCYDPTQSSGYMRDQARTWMQWLVKQTGIDGFRFDAVKHFPYFVVEDVLYNVQHNNGWANLGDEALSVGEWVGSAGQLDDWTDDVQGRAGTF
ncbi:MAG: hypothetical protein KDC54_01720, partial [Lewinella sp.]|nr:hypothetical protein [Lewinella sp.]